METQTGHPLGYVEQLYTFADPGRTGSEQAPHIISISYLGLTRETPVGGVRDAHWSGWYDYFPWEDHRAGRRPDRGRASRRDCGMGEKRSTAAPQRERWQRAAITFGLDDREWNEELVLQRYELLYEAGWSRKPSRVTSRPSAQRASGRPMADDHRRILATGIARLRAKIKYRPVVFELMPAEFTLLQLQRSVEALAGRLVHKQNFRRLIEQQQLVEETGAIAADTVGRPAKLFRFRHAVLAERAIAGTKLPLSRT